MKPFTKNRFHYNWHWIWDTGNGECGNQAIHEIDIARWGLGVDWPTSVSAQGGHFMFEDDQETPNVLNATAYFGGEGSKRKMMELEVRHWHTNHEAEIGTGAYKSAGVPAAGLNRNSARPRRCACREKTAYSRRVTRPEGREVQIPSAIFSTEQKAISASTLTTPTKLGSAKTSCPARPAKVPPITTQNFIDCVRSRKTEDIHSPIEEAHKSTTLVHLANASYRLGRTLHFDGAKQEVISDPEANAMLRGTYRAPYVVTENM